MTMENDEFLRLLGDYLEPPADPNPAMVGIQFIWVEDAPGCGARHMREHGVSKEEVEQVILETPPLVEAKVHLDYPDRTIFWGATRQDRWLFIVCVDWEDSGFRYLKPITAYEPDEGEAYWRRQ